MDLNMLKTARKSDLQYLITGYCGQSVEQSVEHSVGLWIFCSFSFY